MKTFKVALFDLDGTLLNTEPQYTGFWGDFGRRYRPDIPDFAFRIKGTTLTSVLGKYFPQPEMEKVVVEELDAFEARMDFPDVPGATAFVKDLKAHGVKCAVVTSSNKPKMDSVWRKRPDFLNLFDKIMTSEDFSASKPDPDCYLKGAEFFAEEKENCIVFEDAINGLQAGKASGIFTIGLTTGNPKEVVEKLCDHVIPDFEGLNYEKIVELR